MNKIPRQWLNEFKVAYKQHKQYREEQKKRGHSMAPLYASAPSVNMGDGPSCVDQELDDLLNSL